MTVEKYARESAARLLNGVEKEIRRVAKEQDAAAIHDLRVSIRRLTQALRAFRLLFGEGEVKQVRASLRELMDIAAEIRSRDIVLELFEAAEVALNCPACRRVRKERTAAARRMVSKARAWNR